jgi:parallel beta-helix repeat protein
MPEDTRMTTASRPVSALSLRLLACCTLLLALLAARAGTVLVTTTADTGAGSLREAIIAANAAPGTTIQFNIPTTDTGYAFPVWTIKPATTLPAITADGTVVDGASQTTFAGNTNSYGPEIVLNGSLGGGVGLRLQAANCEVRGFTIQYFSSYAIFVMGTNDVVYNCFIGTSHMGTFAASNTIGIYVYNSTGCTIGGAGRGNVITSNLAGIKIDGSNGTVIQGNYLGTSATGSGSLPNYKYGIQILGNNTLVGGTTTAAGNIIANSYDCGIVISKGTGNSISHNSIYNNRGLGIDLGLDGPTQNDTGDGDTGANALMNTPVIIDISADRLTISGTLNSSATEPVTVEVFQNTAAHLSGFGEGQTFLGSATVSAGTWTLTLGTPLAANAVLAATATDADGNTSEFSAAVPFTRPTLLVTNTNDSGTGSLRAAITSANATSGALIAFNIPLTDPGYAGGVFTIRPTSALPMVTSTWVTIDGATQTAFTGDTNPAGPEIVLNGAFVTTGGNGLQLHGANAAVTALTLQGFMQYSISITGNSARVQGCYIGTNATGTAKVANTHGIYVSADRCIIGGTQPGMRNVISGNTSYGIWLVSGYTHVVQGNYIGVYANGAPSGVTNNGLAISGASECTIGGIGDGQANVIAGNYWGVFATSGRMNAIRGNSIWGNKVSGIDLGNSGITANDAGDVDSGANDLMNYPLITGISADRLTVSGTLDSGATGPIIVDVYQNDVLAYPSYGQGQTYLGSAVVNNGTWSLTLTTPLPVKKFLAATATDAANNTSEFGPSVCSSSSVVVTNTNDAGAGSLRDAIMHANAAPGTIILFRIPSSDSGYQSGVFTIKPASNLPTITANGTWLYGESQSSILGETNAAGPEIVIYGLSYPAVALSVTGNDCVISGINVQYFKIGLQISGARNTVQGCYLGTQRDGNTASACYTGIQLDNATDCTIGGSTTAARNVISGNTTAGIVVTGGSGNRICGNYIGLRANATGALGNTQGVLLDSSGTIVGGAEPGAGNIIAYNGNSGVRVASGTGNRISQNSLYSNTLAGIDLDQTGHTDNDPGDVDSGPNALMNAPVITSISADRLTITGTLDSGAPGPITIEVFLNTTAHASNYGEGNTFLGSATVVNGAWSLTVGSALSTSAILAATATDANGNTSEFSENYPDLRPQYIVTNTNDNGTGSLRAAITAANATPGSLIIFNIPVADAGYSSGVWTIKPLTALPTISAAYTTIDGATQTAFAGDTNPQGPEILLNGSSTAYGSSGISVSGGSGTIIRNLVIQGFAGGSGVYCNAVYMQVQGCYLGTNANGIGAVANYYGIRAANGGHYLTAGGITPGTGNLIGGGNAGIYLDFSSGHQILGNQIGIDKSGAPIGSTIGISLQYANASTIGSPREGGANIVAKNNTGICIISGTNHRITRNSIFGNNVLGIDLYPPNMVNANDAGDVDTGTNNLMNFPVITGIGDDRMSVSGTLDSGATGPITVELFLNDVAHSTGYGEGQTYLGSAVVADGAWTVTLATPLPSGKYLTATATDAAGNTSEFGKVYSSTPTIVVTNTNNDGTGSLRAAITYANAVPGTRIAFNIPTTDTGFAGGVFTLRPTAPLPAITGAGTFVDGTSQTNFTGNTNAIGPEIVLVGSGAVPTGLALQANNCQITSIVVQGCPTSGITLTGTGNSVAGCFLGINAFGIGAIPNGTGIMLDTATGCTIGGTQATQRNVISGNTVGISVRNGGGNNIQGNFIGTLYNGSGLLPNAYGITIDGSGTRIGGTAPGAANTIAGSGGNAVAVRSGTGNTISRNSIWSNSGLGIDLGFPGPNADDAGDADDGANALMNAPVITGLNAERTVVSGTLDSAHPGPITIELFINDAAHASGYGEGRFFLGATTVTDGAWSLAVEALSTTAILSATATDAQGNTSEFSAVYPPKATAIVTNTNDSGTGSLRAAIGVANLTSGTRIVFNIPTDDPGYSAATGTFTIRPLSTLPSLTAPWTMVDGASQTAFAGDTNPAGPEIVINGTGSSGLTLMSGASYNSIRSLVIQGFTTGNAIFSYAGYTQVQGCYLGTDATGTTAVPNHTGIYLSNAGGARIEGNLIAGNSMRGIYATGGSGLIIQGNTLGTDATGTRNLGNGYGIYLNAVNGCQIGGATTALGNTVAFSKYPGIYLSSGTGNLISHNSCYGNSGQGIDLGIMGVTPNDSGDADTGANLQMNFPVITGFTTDRLSVSGTLDSTATGPITVELYLSDAPHTSGYGEGRTFQGSATVIDGTWTVTLASPLPSGKYLTATATDALGNTSEFGKAVITTFTTIVTNTNDSGPGSLRNAIEAANARPGTLVVFNIPTSDPRFMGGVFTITPTSALPAITANGTAVDGATQTAFTGPSNSTRPVVMLTGKGLTVNADSCTVKGLIVGNCPQYGVAVSGTGNAVTGCLIGLNAAGYGAAWNGTGVLLDAATSCSVTGNTISGNAVGVAVRGGGGNTVQGNTIGVNTAGTWPVSNGTAIMLDGSSTLVGVGKYGGAPNIIANSTGTGITVRSGTGNTISRNSIYANTGLGIDLAPSGVNANDPGDTETSGANALINAPVITGVDDTRTTISGTLDSGKPGPITIEVFLNTATHASGCGEGRTYLGSATVTDGAWSLTVPALAANAQLSATATDADGNTSEFGTAYPSRAAAIVTNTNDSGPGSLRNAITVANAAPGTRIIFNIPLGDPGYTDGVFIIRPSSNLPALNAAWLTLDGATQTAFTGDTNPRGPEIAISGGASSIGLTLYGPATYAAVRNIAVTGCPSTGILVYASNATVQGCYVGVSPFGAAAESNSYGIRLSGASNSLIGGPTAATRNVISGNPMAGVHVQGGGGHQILSNLIGTDATGTAPLPNGYGLLLEGTTGCTVGDADAGNVIAYNTRQGIFQSSGSGNRFTRNAIFGNWAPGIDLYPVGVTPNDAGDTDSGANGLMNTPVITEVADGNTVVRGTLDTNAPGPIVVELFQSDMPDPTGYGQGQTWLGSAIATDGVWSVSLATPLAAGKFLSATATSGSNDTSEFSRVFVTTAVNYAPTDIALSNTTVQEGLPIGTTVGRFSTTDADAGQAFVYTLVSGEGDDDNAAFTIDGNMLQTAQVFNRAQQTVYHLRVRSTDSGWAFIEKAFTVTVIGPLPTIDALAPSWQLAGAPGFTLTVVGRNFQDGAAIRWNGQACATTAVDATTLTAEIPAAAIAEPGTADVTVANPGEGGTSDPAVFTIKARITVTGQASEHGSITPAGDTIVPAGSDVAFIATPDSANYAVDTWYVDDVAVQVGRGTFLLPNVQAAHTVRVTFTRLSYVVSVSAREHGSVTPNGDTTVPAGDNLTLTATPEAGFQVDKWWLDGIAVQTGGTTNTLANVQSAHRVRVTFGAVLLFTATPPPGYKVKTWTVNGTVVQTGGNTYTLPASMAGSTVVATFAPATVTVRVVVIGNGSVTPSGTITVNWGGSLTCTAVPRNNGVLSWMLDGTTVQTGGLTFTLERVESDCTLTVAFSTVPAISGVQLAATPASPQRVGSDITLTATAQALPGTPLEYCFKATYATAAGTSTETLRDWSPASTCTWRPATARTFTLSTYVRMPGYPTPTYSAALDFAVTSPTLTGVALASDLPTPQAAGQAIRLTAIPQAAAGAVVEYQFKAWYPNNTGGVTWETLRDWSTGATCTWTPLAVRPYTLVVYAREGGSAAEYQVSATLPYDITTSVLRTLTLSASPTSPQKGDQNINLIAIATGNTAGATLQYRFRITYPSAAGPVTETTRDWSTVSTCTWRPMTARNYTLYVDARQADYAGDAACQLTASLPYVVTSPVLTGVTLGPSTPGPRPVGTMLQVYANPVGAGSTQVLYQFKADGPAGTQVLQNFGPLNYNYWTPTVAGTYTITVYAKQADFTDGPYQAVASQNYIVQ